MDRFIEYLEKAYAYINVQIWGNNLHQWLIAFCSFFLIWLLARVIIKHLHNLTKNSFFTKGNFRPYFGAILESIHTITILLVALSLSTSILELSTKTENWINQLAVLAVIFQLGLTLSTIFSFTLPKWFRATEEDPSKMTALGLVSFVGRFIIWLIVLLLMLDNSGVDITALIAGLGVGGIAIALAVQNVLGDLLASLSIVLDKPFQVGDFVVVGDLQGNVERIGIKTTRVRSLNGEQLVFSNSDLLSSRIKNFKRMHERRILFKLGVTYQTSSEKLELIPKIIKETIDACENTRFDRAHFMSYGDFALMFEVVFYVTSRDYLVYADAQQQINLVLFKRFKEEGIEFAYPTQTLFLEKTAE